MAVAAGTALADEPEGAPLYFATSNPPFFDKSNATIVRAALGWDDRHLTADLGGLRGGFAALSLAASTGGVAVMGDHRNGRLGSGEEVEGGDAGAAFLFGNDENAVAKVLATASISTELMDVWRAPGAKYSGVWEERFAQHVLTRTINDAVTEVSKSGGIAGSPTVTLVSSPQRRFALSTAASVGSTGGLDVLVAHRTDIGYCGAADIGVLLAAALDSARVGDTILAIDAVGGADAMLLEVLRTGPGSQTREAQLKARRSLRYVDFLTWSGRLDREPARRPEKPGVAAPPAYRNVEWKYAMVGGRCVDCNKVYLPAQRVCGNCGATDRQAPYSVLGRAGQVAAISTDGVTETPAPPAIAATIDFDGGGRLMMEIADSDPDGIALGDAVTPVFRRTYQVGGLPNYFWKARRTNGAG